MKKEKELSMEESILTINEDERIQLIQRILNLATDQPHDFIR